LQIKIGHLILGITLRELVGEVCQEEAVDILKHHKLAHGLVVHSIKLHNVKQRVGVNQNHQNEDQEKIKLFNHVFNQL